RVAAVALRAERVALGAQRERVRVVTVAARDTGAVHRALHERAVLVHLVADLAVRLVQAGFEQRGAECVEEGAARCGVRTEHRAPRMARRAGFQLGVLAARGLTVRDPRALREGPARAGAAERRGQSARVAEGGRPAAAAAAAAGHGLAVRAGRM